MIIYFIAVAFIITGLLLWVGSKTLKRYINDIAKGKEVSYECRYADLSELRCLYSLQFYIVRLSFIIFDLEILLFVPLLVSLSISFRALLRRSIFLSFIIILLVVEIRVRVLDWSK